MLGVGFEGWNPGKLTAVLWVTLASWAVGLEGKSPALRLHCLRSDPVSAALTFGSSSVLNCETGMIGELPLHGGFAIELVSPCTLLRHTVSAQ